MSKEEADLAWLTGLLHDIGRFEQIRRYGTFNDALSINHGMLSVEILFEDGMIREFIDDESTDDLIRKTIGCHNAYMVPEEFSKREKIFCNILRDADKIDIFKVNIVSPLEEVYNVPREEIYNSQITEAVMEDFKRKKTVLRSLRKSAADNVACHISLVFGLVYDESLRITVQQAYLDEMMNFESKIENTNKQLKEIRTVVKSYINERLDDITE
ncbi:MAG: HD domain-containing protein [Clostridium sp.]|nr:HD domain-containing protein [Clostridium sp.]